MFIKLRYILAKWLMGEENVKKIEAEMGVIEASRIKDPMDYTSRGECSGWDSDSYCPRCRNHVGHSERMADICNSCGRMGSLHHRRSYRKIYTEKGWCYQFNYGNDKSDMHIVPLEEGKKFLEGTHEGWVKPGKRFERDRIEAEWP